MHLLESDVSTSPPQWFMDSPMVRKTEEKPSMISTQSRIDTSLAPTIGDAVIRGDNFSPPHCRAFSKTAPRFTIGLEYDNAKISPSRSPGHQNYPKKETPASKEGNDLHSDRQASGSSPSSATDQAMRHRPSLKPRESSLNGFINGFFVHNPYKAKEESTSDVSQRTGTQHPLQNHCCSLKVERSQCPVNENSNNNRTSPLEALGDEHHAHKDSDIRKGGAIEYLDYRKPNALDSAGENRELTGCDILKRMYASFGSRPGGANGSLRPSFDYIPENSSSQVQQHHGSTRSRNESRAESPPEKQPREMVTVPGSRRSDEASLSITNSCAVTDSSHCSPTDTNIGEGKSRDQSSKPHEGTLSDCGVRSTKNVSNFKSPHRNKICKNEMKVKTNLSPHSIDSLLSRRRKTSVGVSERAEHVSESVEGSNRDRERQISSEGQGFRKRKREIASDRSAEYSDSEREQICHSPKRSRPTNRHAYDEKSHKISRQDEGPSPVNPIRPSAQLPYSEHPQGSPLHEAPWQSPSAMAALQANLLSSFQQNGPVSALNDQALLLKSASIAAATNPLLLNMNPCLMNPYLLQNFGSTEVAAAAAYHQAMAQGLMQNHPAINPLLSQGLMGSTGLHPFIYGLQDPTQIAAALAASMRQNAAALYPNAQVPYSIMRQHLGQVEDFSKSELATINTRNSPSCSPNSKRTALGGISADHGPSKYRRSSREVRSDSGDDYAKRARKDSTHAPDRPRALKLGKPAAVKRSMKPFAISSPSLPFGQNRKSPSQLSADNPPTSMSKKQMCVTRIDSTHKKPPKDFSPSSLLKPLQTKSDDGNDVSSELVEKCRSVDKISSRPSSYKNLTRERRLVANARERTRVHTISSAFEELRLQIPSYSCNQKLSKLAILRIACSYIQSLSVLSGRSTEGTFKESVDQCTRVLQAESRARSRRKNNKAQIEWEVANYEKASSYDSEVRRKTDSAGRSPVNSPSVCRRGLTAASSLSLDGNAQVHSENAYRKLNDSRSSEREFSRDASLFVNATCSEDTDCCVDQYDENTVEDIAMTSGDSLDADAARIEKSPVNEAGSGADWTRHKRPCRQDDIARVDTWHGEIAQNSTTAAVPGESEGESDSERPNPDQNDLINVED